MKIFKNLKGPAAKLSHSDFQQMNINKIENELLKNNFPDKLIEAIQFRENISNDYQEKLDRSFNKKRLS